MVVNVSLFIVVGFLLWLVVYLYRGSPPRQTILGNKFPGFQAYPIVGNVLQIGTNSHDLFNYLLKSCQKFYGSAFRMWIGNKLSIFLTTPKDIDILLSDPNQLRKATFYNYFLNWLGPAIIVSTGAQWKQTRKFLAAVMTKTKMEDYIETFHTNAKILVEIMRVEVGGPAFNAQHYSSLNAIDNMSETFTGHHINAQNNADSKYVQAVHNQAQLIVNRTFKPWLQPDWLFNLTSLKKKEDASIAILHATNEEAIALRREKITKEREAQKDKPAEIDDTDGSRGRHKWNYLDVLIQSTYEGSDLTDVDIRGEIATLGAAGQDTISIATAFAMWNLAWHPQIQDAVLEEINEVWTEKDKNMTHIQLKQLKYLERVLKETLRLYPSLPAIGRNINVDTEFGGGLICPKDTDVLVGIYLVHRDPAYYPDPEKFDPDRFLPENAQGRPASAYIPFSMGPRICPAVKFSMLEMKCNIAHILTDFQVLPGSKESKLKVCTEPVLTVKEGIPIKLVLRKQ